MILENRENYFQSTCIIVKNLLYLYFQLSRYKGIENISKDSIYQMMPRWDGLLTFKWKKL